MGCNCKKTYNKMKKYADNRDDLERQEEINQRLVNKIARLIQQIAIGIIASIFFIIIAIPIVIYIFGCILFGKEPYVRILKMKNLFRKRNAGK